MSDTGHNGNGGDKKDADIAALEEGLIEHGAALQRLLDQHDKAEKRLADELVAKVSSAVAIVLEHRLVPLERSIGELRQAVGDLTQAVNIALRRV